jgi:hypothetical protein
MQNIKGSLVQQDARGKFRQNLLMVLGGLGMIYPEKLT